MSRGAAKVAGLYFVAGTVWILWSDRALLEVSGTDLLVGQAKGLLFVATTTVLLYVLIARELRAREATEQERTELEHRLGATARFELMGQLASGIAHDFNNLMTAISGNIEAYMIQFPELAGKSLELHEARHSAHRAAALTRQLLAFGRSSAGSPERIGVNAVIRDMSGLLHRLIGKGIRIRTELADDPDAVLMDRGRLEQVIMNLAINARDAMPKGGEIRLTTSCTHLSENDLTHLPGALDPGDYVRIDVADTGIGMSRELQGHIFEPFFTTKPREVGTGLGLATVKGIVTAAGGDVRVSGAPGAGTTFTVLLPYAPGGEAPSVAAPLPVLGEAEEGSETVLVVEDDDAVRSLLVRVLRSRGFVVLEAPHGRAALDLLREPAHAVDLLLTDWVMPELSGHQVIEAARAIRPGLPALLISGYPDEDEAISVPYLAKPFTTEELVRRVREVLDG